MYFKIYDNYHANLISSTIHHHDILHLIHCVGSVAWTLYSPEFCVLCIIHGDLEPPHVIPINLAFGLSTGILPSTSMSMTALTLLSTSILITWPYQQSLISLAISGCHGKNCVKILQIHFVQ